MVWGAKALPTNPTVANKFRNVALPTENYFFQIHSSELKAWRHLI